MSLGSPHFIAGAITDPRTPQVLTGAAPSRGELHRGIADPTDVSPERAPRSRVRTLLARLRRE